jgi:uncharacterized radical SAM protein YgiQ
VLPSFEQVSSDKRAFAEATRLIHNETNPYNARRLIQWHGRQAVVVNPPGLPLGQASMDRVYNLPFTRQPHHSYREPIPAFTMIKDSVTIMRGCFGGCTFCSITAHQGRIIQSRSEGSIVQEVQHIAAQPNFTGTISDIGGPTANMYQMQCSRPEIEAICRRQSCVHPTICKLLGTDHGPLIQLMRKTRKTHGVKQVRVSSGIRMDLANRSAEYIRELVRHHVGGYLKVAPEHTDPGVLDKMRKPNPGDFQQFAETFTQESRQAGKKQYLIPYFIASHPSSDLHAMIDLAVFLKRHGYRPDQVQDFIPAPMDVATAMYYTGLDPFTRKPVYVARHLRDRKLQRALMQFFQPDNYFEVREALRQAGRQDLIGGGCDCLIPARPPAEAIQRRRRDARARFRGEYIHEMGPDADSATAHPPPQRPKETTGYRPGRKGRRKRAAGSSRTERGRRDRSTE